MMDAATLRSLIDYYRARHGRWFAKITVNYRVMSLGHFGTFEEAKSARQTAERAHGFTVRA